MKLLMYHNALGIFGCQGALLLALAKCYWEPMSSFWDLKLRACHNQWEIILKTTLRKLVQFGIVVILEYSIHTGKLVCLSHIVSPNMMGMFP